MKSIHRGAGTRLKPGHASRAQLEGSPGSQRRSVSCNSASSFPRSGSGRLQRVSSPSRGWRCSQRASQARRQSHTRGFSESRLRRTQHALPLQSPDEPRRHHLHHAQLWHAFEELLPQGGQVVAVQRPEKQNGRREARLGTVSFKPKYRVWQYELDQRCSGRGGTKVVQGARLSKKKVDYHISYRH